MNLVSPLVASEAVAVLLYGAQLDTIRVYSLIVQLGFVRLGDAVNLPSEVWVSLSGELASSMRESAPAKVGLAGDFYMRRVDALSAVYRLLGESVTAAGVSGSGALEIYFGGTSLRVELDDEASLEEVWSVASDSPETTAVHRWYVALNESGELFAHVPG